MNDSIYVVDANGYDLARLDSEADARLISAAPDLLEELNSMLKDFVDDLSGWGYDEDDIADHPQVKAARAAIAKAKGDGA